MDGGLGRGDGRAWGRPGPRRRQGTTGRRASRSVTALNTSTISGQKLPLAQEIEIVAKAGYSGIEPWIREMDQHVKDGGSLADLGKKASDLG